MSWRLVRSEHRPNDTVAFEEAVVGFFLDSAAILGIPKSVAALYGICFSSAVPLSFTDIEQRLNISKGSISQGLRVLREVGALRVVQATDGKGKLSDRRDHYEPDLHLRNLVTRWLEQRLQKQLESGQDRLKTIAKTIPAGNQGSAKVLKDRIKTLHTWQKQAGTVLPVVKTFLKLT